MMQRYEFFPIGVMQSLNNAITGANIVLLISVAKKDV